MSSETKSAPRDTRHALAVFCGSRMGRNKSHQTMANDLGRIMAERRIELIYGGGGIGLMGVMARAVMAGGGRVVGVIPEALDRVEVGLRDVDEFITTRNMHERKQIMFERADGFLIIPGGLGTLDELLEVLTYAQLRMHSKPIVLLNAGGYWDSFLNMMQHIVDAGFAGANVLELLSVAESVEESLSALGMDGP